MSAPTPGPWTAVQREFGYPEIEGGPERRLWSVQAKGYNLAGLTIYSHDEADARLIAAAPDMLEALRDLHDDIQGRMDDGVRFNPGTLTALKAAHDALAKAEPLPVRQSIDEE